MAGANDSCCIFSSIIVLSFWDFCRLPRKTLVLYDFALCTPDHICVSVGISCVHPSHTTVGYLFFEVKGRVSKHYVFIHLMFCKSINNAPYWKSILLAFSLSAGFTRASTTAIA